MTFVCESESAPSQSRFTYQLFADSQPTAGLQIFSKGEWKYVRHYPNGILVNLGDAIEFTTGGLLKAAVHRGMVIHWRCKKKDFYTSPN